MAHSHQPSMDQIEAQDGGEKMIKIRARVYAKDGNRFLIPGHWYCDDDPDIGMGSASAVICDSMMWGVVCNLKADDWIDLEGGPDGQATIEHYRYDMNGRQFAHGGVTVFLIGGPLFDAEHAEAVRLGNIPPDTERPCPRCGEMRDADVPDGCRDPKCERMTP